MKFIESVPSENATRRLVLVRVVAAVVVVTAVILAPPVSDSIATLNARGLDFAESMDDGGKPTIETGISIDETRAVPIEPLSMSY